MSSQEPQKSNTILIIIAIIGFVSTVVAATIGAVANYNTEKLRQDTELTRIALASTNSAQTTATPSIIFITLTNNNCHPLYYYLDGNLIFSPIEAGSTLNFSTTPGRHVTYNCTVGTTTCTEPNWYDWTTSTAYSIGTGDQCPITITLINNNCEPLDYYLDGNLIFSPIEAGSTLNFSTTPGRHITYNCAVGTTTCAEPNWYDWTTSTTHSIGRGDQCP